MNTIENNIIVYDDGEIELDISMNNATIQKFLIVQMESEVHG